MASSQDEFADAIRNVHLPAGTEVYVKALVVGVDGNEHIVKRVLTADYAKKQDCRSRLEIDGQVVDAKALAGLGIVLSQPPIAAPVLAQHTLSFIFSVGPQNRSTYFKALLEVTDLDELRNDIASAALQLKTPESSVLTKFDKCAALPPLASSIGTLRTTIPTHHGVAATLANGAAALITSAGEAVPHTTEERLGALERILADQRSKTFPVSGFKRSELPAWTTPDSKTWSDLDTYVVERSRIDADTRRLATLFGEVLRLPAVESIQAPIACPVCSTPEGLTPARVEAIRDHVAKTNDFRTADTAARTALSSLSASAAALASAVTSALPLFWRQSRAGRRTAGFSITRLRSVLDARASEVLPSWFSHAVRLLRASRRLAHAANALTGVVSTQTADIEQFLDPATLRTAVTRAEQARSNFMAAIESYSAPAQRLGQALNEVIDAQSSTAGWQELLDIAAEPETLRQALIDRRARAQLRGETDVALRQIDDAKEQVLNDKFAEYSGQIQAWWERLRPDEPTFFTEVKPRKGAKRTIDFKAGLSATPDRKSPKVRDVIAVFSQSQLHCLGLSLFLARAEQDGTGFIVLDDPVLSSDEDYRVHFNTTVIEALLDLPLQVIVITQDHKTWIELDKRYRHRGMSRAQLVLDDPRVGTEIENTSEELLAMLSRAASMARGGHPDSRKSCGLQLRDAGERFCKELLVNDARAKGNDKAVLADYDGKALEWLCPRVEPLLDRDASHAGKFEAFRDTVNDACHDNQPPSTAAMKHACGELKYLVKEYLTLG